ncbi:hypothetical protein [Corynebacterium sp. AOP12-C2-36]|uniref:hypothetical protein n=3 Tax=unclassified Corynebacterium TaxID=2624378 RepID=UPI004033B626
MTTIPASRVRRCCAALLTGSLVLTASACGGDGADGPDDTTPTAAAAETGTDFSLSYDVPERWDADSVTAVLESSMIGGGVESSGAVVGDALYVGEGLNQVKRSTEEDTELLDVTPLKQSSAGQQDYRIDSFSRQGADYVALWRKGVAESNDSRRLGDETSADAQVFLSVWDEEGSSVYDDVLDGVNQIGEVHAGLIHDSSDVYDPLTGDTMSDGDAGNDADDGPSEEVVGYGATASAPLVEYRTPGQDDLSKLLNHADLDYGTDEWKTSELLTLPERGRFSFETVIGDYAVFAVQDELFSVEGLTAVDISSGEVAARTDDSCSTSVYFDDDQPVLSSPDGSTVVYGEYMVDADEGIFSCQKSRRGGFEPRIVLDDGTVYGYGEQGSGDGAQQVAASMQVGDEEALMEQGSLPIHVDADGRGWFADAVNHSNGTDTVVAVVEPAEGGSRS